MDATTELALAIHGAPGAYAILLGSGVSRGAGIPSGWEVTLDLIQRLAVASDEEAPAEPLAWYDERYERPPDYSEILEKLAATPSERQALLRNYFEPTATEREEGIKQPTGAHHAVADLASRGMVRLVLTTNFDRLMEQAFDSAGVPYDVWNSSDAIHGGVPLSHGRVVLVKLHGDYRDTRLLNTLSELEAYDPAIASLLDRVLDEFGLIVCGWSGVWDRALRAAILRSPNRRFRTFWAARHGRVTDEAQGLIDHREARIVAIEDASEFLLKLAAKIAALEEMVRPHPASVELAVGTLKRYMTDHRDRIRLTDVVMEEARRLRALLSDAERYPVANVSVSPDILAEVAHRYEADTEIMISLMAHLGAHGDRADHRQLAVRALDLIANPEGERGGLVVRLALRRYPALLCFYALGLGAVSSDNWDVFRGVAIDARWHDVNGSEHLAAALHPYRVFDNAEPLAQFLATGGSDPPGKRYTPHSDYLHELLHDPLIPLLDSDQRYDVAFDRFEYLVGVLVSGLQRSQAHELAGPHVPNPYVGRQHWRNRHTDKDPIAQWADGESATLAARLMPEATEGDKAWDEARENFDEWLAKSRRGRF